MNSSKLSTIPKNPFNIWKSLNILERKVNHELNADLKRFHILTLPQFEVLNIVNEEPMSMKKIGNKLNVTGANITCIVDNLERNNLVRRIFNKEDRRVIIIELTDKGKNVHSEAEETVKRTLGETINTLSDEEKSFLGFNNIPG